MRSKSFVGVTLLLALTVSACRAPMSPTPTSQPPTATVQVPKATVTVAPPTALPTVALPTATPAAIPTREPVAEWMALYAAGTEEETRLYALSTDGTVTNLGLQVYRGTAISTSGRWLASPNSYPMAGSVLIHELQGETRYEIAATPGWGVYGMAFDPDETRLAFLELAPANVPDIPWAIVVVRLADGATTRFERTTHPDKGIYPGNPLGWVSSGRELLLNTFLPYSDGIYAGVWAVEIPPDAASASLDTVTWRELIPGGSYLSIPQISPDGTRLAYLNRDRDYMPADYEPALDFAVNELWTLDIASATATRLYDVQNGDALGSDTAWAPQGAQILFAQGHYAGMRWGSLALQLASASGQVTHMAQMPPSEWDTLLRVNWCRPDTALALLTMWQGTDQLYTVDVEQGIPKTAVSAETLFVLGCVSGKTYESYTSPDGQWQAQISHDRPIQAGDEARGYDQLRVYRAGSDKADFIDEQSYILSGLGAYGLGGRFWSPNSRYFYYTTAKLGVPDGCGYWERPLVRVDTLEKSKELLGGGPLSPDQTRLATWQEQDLVVWDLDQVENKRTPAAVPDAQPGPIAWAPDGRSLVYLQNVSHCPPEQSSLVHLDLETLQHSVLFESRTPGFLQLVWKQPDRIELGDMDGHQWEYDLVTNKLKEASAAVQPTATPPSGELTADWLALYSSGQLDDLHLYALSPDGARTSLDTDVNYQAAVSKSGRWLASPSSAPGDQSVWIENLETGKTYTVPVTAERRVVGCIAFHAAETHLAFLEIQANRPQDWPWAIVVVRLVDGSTTRFQGTTRQEGALEPRGGYLPGIPLGWTPSGEEMVMDTLMPFTEGQHMTLWAVGLSPNAPPAPLDDLAWREVIPKWNYYDLPAFSPDGKRLLYLAHDRDYTPADYTPLGESESVVDQLWSLEVEGGTPELLYEVTNGDVLGEDAVWSPDGKQVLLVQGRHAGPSWASLALYVRDEADQVREVAPLPTTTQWVMGLDWCRPNTVLVTLSTQDGARLYMLDVEGRDLELAASDTALFVLGCR